MPWSAYTRPAGDVTSIKPFFVQLPGDFAYWDWFYSPASGDFLTLNDISKHPQFRNVAERTNDGRLQPKGSAPFPMRPSYRKPIRQVG
jgi:hypothetical protein